MKWKPIFKTLWISILSTFILVLSQNLTEKGFQDINTIKTAFVELPIEYFVVNIFVFILLTVLFININDYLPVKKLGKGLVFVSLVSLIWIALRFQPLLFENIKQYLFDSFVFLIPMMFFGIFLGYLASNKKTIFKFRKRQFSYLIIAVVWMLFHIIYMAISGSAKGQMGYYLTWLFSTSIVIAIVFGILYEINYTKTKNPFINMSLSVIIIFVTYYSYRFAIQGEFDLQLLIRVLLDFISVILAVQIIELYFNNFKPLEKEIDR